jgi:hypothetical protein
MDLLKAVEERLDAALPVIGLTSFPGMSADEVDAFSLGYFAGAMAYELISTGVATLPDDIARRVEAEIAHVRLDYGARGATG